VILHAAALTSVTRFVIRLRNANSAVRTSEIRPHRYFRHEKNLSHPLPHLNAGGGLDGQVMGMAETMSRDVRSDALRVLEVACLLTANPSDACARRSLRKVGSVTAMVALLGNESGAVTELACACLANLLCTTLGDGYDDDASSESMRCDDVNPRAVVERCNGKDGLRALLTSPSARIISNTSITPAVRGGGAERGVGIGGGGGGGGRRRVLANSRGGSGGGSGQMMARGATRQTHTLCMGMASKHAARALCK
jgi:hypothetical protein